jgi:hypothetical protein
MNHPGTRGLLFRRTFPELNKNHILRVWEQFPQLRKYYNKQERVITFPNGSILTFGYAEFDSDIGQYQGDAYDDIFIDQSEQHSEYIISELKANNRPTSRALTQAKFVLSFNPGGASHKWHKSKFNFTATRDRCFLLTACRLRCSQVPPAINPGETH